jgi:hypothetical protein
LEHKTFDIGQNASNGDYGFSLSYTEVQKQEATGFYSCGDKTSSLEHPDLSADVSLLKVDFSSVASTNNLLKNKLDSVNNPTAPNNIVDYRSTALGKDD